MRTFFITGTDTDAGKTVASRLILNTLSKQSDFTLGIKPISAGCEQTNEGLRNSDALILQKASTIKAPYDVINPIAFGPPIAPHIAAELDNCSISMSDLQTCLEKARMFNPRWLLVEGAGGWRLPLDKNGTYYSDFALQNQMKVILVVGMKLGCLNHAILSAQAIHHDRLQLVGWVANQLSDDMLYYQQNIDTLERLLGAPLLAEIPYQGDKLEAQDVNQIHLTEAFSQVFR